MVNTIRGLNDKVVKTIVSYKVLRYLPKRFNAKISTTEERKALDNLKIREINKIFTVYEKRIKKESS